MYNVIAQNVLLGPGDVIQFGEGNPVVGAGGEEQVASIDWGPPQVVHRGETSNDILTFPVIHNEEGGPVLELPGTTRGGYVRLLGKLTLEELKSLFSKSCPEEYEGLWMETLFPEGKQQEVREYDFKQVVKQHTPKE